jgi:two-component system, chemotaxis family, protein-glutamate methylesterase/glutaminase
MSKPAPNAEPVPITCPGCAGVLSLLHEPGTMHTHYTCQVGHTFTLPSLLAAKEEELEKTLWAAMAFLEHVELITQRFIAESETSGLPIDRKAMEARIRQTADQRRQLRKLIEESEPANLDADAAKRK